MSRALGRLGPFLILAAGAGWLWSCWDQIPARIATHYDASGQPNGWTDKTPLHVFGLLLIGAAFALFFVLLSALVARARAEETNRRLIARILLTAGYLVAITDVVVLLPMTGAPLAVVLIPLPLSLAFVIIVIATSRRTRPVPRTGSDRAPDTAWKRGDFYVNRDDPALFVEKRSGLGYTLNFANPWSWVVIAALIAVITTLGLLLPRLVR